MLRIAPMVVLLTLAQARHPAEEKGIRSLESKVPTALTLVNKSERPVKVYWLDFDGKRKLYETLRPGRRYESQTFVTHPWLVTDAKDRPWAIYLPDAQPRIVEVTRPDLVPWTPTADYEKRIIAGFTVLIHPDVLRQRETADILRELNKQLAEVARVVPSRQLAELRKVKVWLEWDSHGASAAQYHPARAGGWLSVNRLNPDKADSVDVNNARHFLNWSRQAQPSMLLHKLAHAYHFRVLDETHAGVLAAYRQAMERKLYESVAHVRGQRQEAYAAKNDKEYFAELSEAYFGRNDFFPFDRRELEQHDPAGYRLMRDVWGEPSGKR